MMMFSEHTPPTPPEEVSPDATADAVPSQEEGASASSQGNTQDNVVSLRDTALIALELMAKFNQVPINMPAIIKEYDLGASEEGDIPIPPQELLRVLKKLGFKAKLKKIPQVESLKKTGYPFPVLLLQKTGSYRCVFGVTPEKATAMALLPDQCHRDNLATGEAPLSVLREGYSGYAIVAKHKYVETSIQFGLKWFFNEILTYKRILVEVLSGAFLVQVFGLVTPLFTQVILDKVIVHHSMTTLNVLTVAFIAMALFEAVLNLARNYLFVHTASKIDAKLGSKLFKHLFGLPFQYFEHQKVGNIVARVRELDGIREFIANKSISVIVDTIFSGVFVVMMCLYSVKLTAVALVFIVLITLIYVFLTPLYRDRLEDKFKMASQSNAFLVESITGILTVKSLALEGSMQRKWEDALARYLSANFNLAMIGQWAQAFVGLLQKGMTLTILYLGVQAVIDQKLSVGQLIAFQMFMNQLTAPILRLAGLWNELQQALLGIDRLGHILEHPVEISNDPNEPSITLNQIQGDVRFDNVSFRYTSSGPQVLKQVSLRFPAGKMIGLVGRSGSGKSTLTKLIQRLYHPEEGGLFLDNVDMRHMHPTWLRSQIGVVLQDSFLFSGTISDNIRMPRPDASPEMVIRAAQLAGAHEFISQLPQGYNTEVGERGASLSGGQKQRIAIARALITNPRILIFDEATSALDNESERLIVQNLQRIKQGRTVIVIAHRLSTVQQSDAIVVMDAGRPVEAGTHNDLITRGGTYAHLYEQQQREETNASTQTLPPPNAL
jgi:subfamily B ATP-binding cassette protein HlyB/CyaB